MAIVFKFEITVLVLTKCNAWHCSTTVMRCMDNNPRCFCILAYRPAKHKPLNCIINEDEYEELKPMTVYSNLVCCQIG
jgi:hypothetical protein